MKTVFNSISDTAKAAVNYTHGCYGKNKGDNFSFRWNDQGRLFIFSYDTIIASTADTHHSNHIVLDYYTYSRTTHGHKYEVYRAAKEKYMYCLYLKSDNSAWDDLESMIGAHILNTDDYISDDQFRVTRQKCRDFIIDTYNQYTNIMDIVDEGMKRRIANKYSDEINNMKSTYTLAASIQRQRINKSKAN